MHSPDSLPGSRDPRRMWEKAQVVLLAARTHDEGNVYQRGKMFKRQLIKKQIIITGESQGGKKRIKKKKKRMAKGPKKHQFTRI